VPGEEAAGENAVGGDPDPELAAGGEDLALDPARDQGVLDLHVCDGMHGVRAADRLGTDLGEAEVAHVARLDQLCDRAHRLLDRNVREDAAGPIDVDVVRAQSPQRVSEEVLDRSRPQVVADDRPVRAAHEPELDADDRLLAVAAAQRLTDEQLVVPSCVVVARVEQGDAGVERGLDRGDRLRLVGGAVEVGHAHAAEAEGRDREPGGSERACVHRTS
jgi:hypothetical protein